MNKRTILKEHCKDSLWSVLFIIFFIVGVVFFSFYEIDFSEKSRRYISRIRFIRISWIPILFSFWGLGVGRCRRCLMSLLDIWKDQEVSGIMAVYHDSHNNFNMTNKKGYIEIQPKRYSRISLIDINISALTSLYLDERICSHKEFQKMKEKMKHGKKYYYTAYRYSKIITSVQEM